MEKVYQYLVDNYIENEPIFLSDIKIDGMTENNIRQRLKMSTDTGKLKRFDKGIYFLPKESSLGFGSYLPVEKVLERKYIKDSKDSKDSKGRFGYISGLMFFNMIGLTTQLPMKYEVVSNKATSDYREVLLGRTPVVVRRPKVTVTDDNYKCLQFLDMVKDVDVYSELAGDELKARLYRYMDENDIKAADLEPYYKYYPDKLFRNLVETRVIYNGISA
jgi:hypothetical protein